MCLFIISITMYVCMYIHAYVCMYVCMYVYIYIYIHMYVYLSLSLSIYIYIYIYIHIHVHIHRMGPEGVQECRMRPPAILRSGGSIFVFNFNVHQKIKSQLPCEHIHLH